MSEGLKPISMGIPEVEEVEAGEEPRKVRVVDVS